MPADAEPGLARDEERQFRVHLCFGPNCTERGGRALMPVLEHAVREAGLSDRVEVLATTCRNRCEDGPSLNVYPGPVFYNRLHSEAIRAIVRRHLAEGEIVEQWRHGPGMATRTRR